MIRGLTLYQPMAWAIAVGAKRIENRPWKPWIGVTHVAIHAGAKWSAEHAKQIESLLDCALPQRTVDPLMGAGVIVAVARIAKVVTSAAEAEAWGGPEAAAWYSGPFGWCLDDVQPIAFPPECSGALGLWRIPADVTDTLTLQEEVPEHLFREVRRG